ncbi:type II secretion system minor pseudopilin GspI [Pseudomonas sp. EpS/L25]|uniref:type II secretion system minor pseudopilin GspI n=1 Tax=Pseudomonas sp. EpS/L25 TaxID=1749078 RepID=UPI000743B5D5|nr:type II secretion system minor pseudopilin GspI [Pseudomonas sp. EpS/L25]KUM41940.1 hypothetical protein AR540_06870 [Pseudomonas sp. EpS/L25]
MKGSRSLAGGFTLVEILVALAILAVIAAAVLAASQQVSSNLIHLQERSFAMWIAENRLVEMRIATGPLVSSREVREVEFANQRWDTLSVVENTQRPGLRGVTIWVAAEPDGFSSLPLEQRSSARLATYLYWER